MTAVYHLERAKGYEYVNTTNLDDAMLLSHFDGSSRKETWKPFLVTRGPVNRREKGRQGDIPAMFGSLLLCRSAVDALQDILDAHGELLPLETEDGLELYVFNTFFMLEALDMERSEIYRYGATPVFTILKHVFIEEKIRGIDIFRITADPMDNYYSERFVQRVKKAKLKGVNFVKLWSSEDQPTKT